MRDFGPGFIIYGNWGTLDKCPYCTKTDIRRTQPDQVTCGGAACKARRNSEASKNARMREKMRRERTMAK